MMEHKPQQDRRLQATAEVPTMLTMKDIVDLTQTTRSTINRAIAQGLFPPAAVRLGANQPRWFAADYLKWADEQRQKQGTDQPRVKAHRA